MTIAVLEGWRVVALSKGWRRRTGILRAEWLGLPLPAFTHPDDVPRLLVQVALAEYTPASLRLRLGRAGHWHTVQLRLQKRRGLVALKLDADPLPLGQWWWPNAPRTRDPGVAIS